MGPYKQRKPGETDPYLAITHQGGSTAVVFYKDAILQMLERDANNSFQIGDHKMPKELRIAIKHTIIDRNQYLAMAIIVALIGMGLYLTPFSKWEKFLLNKVYIFGMCVITLISAVIFLYYSVGIVHSPVVHSSVPNRRVRSKVFNVVMRMIRREHEPL